MQECYQRSLQFSGVKRRKVEIDFNGGEVTSDGGLLLLREVDRKLGLTKALDAALIDPRVQGRCKHNSLSLLRQRVYALAAGYEDLNDHDSLRYDTAFQTSVEGDRELGSSPTLCRQEQRVDREAAIAMHQVLIDQFIGSFTEPPKRLVLDFDATDNPIQGDQAGKYFNRYYDHYCFLPLYVFCGHQLLVSYLRPSSSGAAYHAGCPYQKLRTSWFS